MENATFLRPWELPPALVYPALRMCRLFNTALDFGFYDAPGFLEWLQTNHLQMMSETTAQTNGASGIDFGGITNPEGSLLVIDAGAPERLRQFKDVKLFMEARRQPEIKAVRTISVTGVGSSALGSAAFAWNVSEAIGEPVIAVVPGYGVADVLMQGIGGWFGFGLYDFLNTKSWIQLALAQATPQSARLGRGLSETVPEHPDIHGAPVFLRGSGSSDVVHALIEHDPLGYALLVGHSKGALVLENAVRGLTKTPPKTLAVVTFGCPITPLADLKSCEQFLGWFDGLGWLNSWGRSANHMLTAQHTTDTVLPLSVPVESLVSELRTQGLI